MSDNSGLMLMGKRIAEHFGWEHFELVPNPRRGAAHMSFLGHLDGKTVCFVKVDVDRVPLEREYRICRLFNDPKCALLSCGPVYMLTMEYRPSEGYATIEELTPEALDTIVRCHREFLEQLSKLPFEDGNGGRDWCERLFAQIADFARQAGWAGRLLRPLLAIPEEFRTFKGRVTQRVHGDFHCRNFGFNEQGEAVIYDCEADIQCVPAFDWVTPIVERYKRYGLRSRERRRLERILGHLMEVCACPREDWILAINLWRLKDAVDVIRKNHGPRRTAFDIWWRDRPLRRLVEYVEHSHATAD